MSGIIINKNRREKNNVAAFGHERKTTTTLPSASPLVALSGIVVKNL
jgi:hypothetical protein